MIGRIWHGWTKPKNADKYEQLLKEEIFPAIGARKVNGYKGIQLFRRPLDNEIEFITIMWFASLDAVRVFAGEDYEVGVVPPKHGPCCPGLMLAHSTMKSRNGWNIKIKANAN